MKNLRAEFSVGDQVTFAPYGRPFRCTVTQVEMMGNEIVYRLSGQAQTRTRPISIVESDSFEAYPSLIAIPSAFYSHPDAVEMERCIDEFNTGEFLKAKGMASRLYRENYTSAQILYFLGEVERAFGHLDEAEKFYRQAEEKGISGAMARFESSKNLAEYYFGNSGSKSASLIVVADKSRAEKVEEAASTIGYSLLGFFPCEDSIPDHIPKHRMADRVSEARFLSELENYRVKDYNLSATSAPKGPSV